MRHQTPLAVAAGLFLTWAAPALPSTLMDTVSQPRIVINDDAGGEAARALGAPFHSVVELRFYSNASFTGGFGLCTGSLISATTILTAQHCGQTVAASQVQVRFTEGDGTLQFARTVSSIDRMSGYSSLLGGADIAVLTMGEAVVDRAPMRVVTDLFLNELVRMVGYGSNGVGSKGHLNTRDGARWAADNIITAGYVASAASGENLIYESVFLPPSDPDSLEFEGTTAPGDSGGPLLVNREGEWVIAGVLSGGTTDTSQYGDISYWTGVHSDEAQAMVRNGGGTFWEPAPLAVIPLPASGLLLLGALGLGGLLCRRRAA